MQQITSEKYHRAFTRGYVLAAIVASIVLHVTVVFWWISRPQQSLQMTGLPTVTVDLIALAPAPPQPVAPMPQPSSPAEPEPLQEEEMAEQVKIIKKKPLEKKRAEDKKPEKISRESSPEVAASTAQANAPATPAPAPMVAARYDADYLNNPPPSYPSISRRLGEEGRVVLRVQVSADGKPLRVEMKSSSGFERLDNAARKAAEAWRFVPAKQAGIAVASWVEVPLQFSLKK